jgi:hypothetical protein
LGGGTLKSSWCGSGTKGTLGPGAPPVFLVTKKKKEKKIEKKIKSLKMSQNK